MKLLAIRDLEFVGIAEFDQDWIQKRRNTLAVGFRYKRVLLHRFQPGKVGKRLLGCCARRQQDGKSGYSVKKLVF